MECKTKIDGFNIFGDNKDPSRYFRIKIRGKVNDVSREFSRALQPCLYFVAAILLAFAVQWVD